MENELYFYPNECFVCKKKAPLTRCELCNMISYCSIDHKMMHYKDHSKLCEVICNMCNDRNVSHIYEGYKDLETQEWKLLKLQTYSTAELRLGRILFKYERQMFEFPRSCFVCHDSRQDLLESCPGCTNASFCINHRNSSTIHSMKDCPIPMQCCRAQETMWKKKNYLPGFIRRKVQEVIGKTALKIEYFAQQNKCVDPVSMSEYMFGVEQVPNRPHRFILEEIFCVPLTVYNALYSLKNSLSETIVIHISYKEYECDQAINRWEVILHLMPYVKNLKIMIFNAEDNAKLECTLCKTCLKNGKVLSIEIDKMNYPAHAESIEFKTPDLLIIMNALPPIIESNEIHQRTWKLQMLGWGAVDCPLVITTLTQEMGEVIKRDLKSTFMVAIYYEGFNFFPAPRLYRLWDNERLYRENHAMIICRVVRFKQLICRRCKSENRTINSKTNNCAYCESELMSTDVALFPKTNNNRFRYSFFASACHYCHCAKSIRTRSLIPCPNCKMVFYCNESHRKLDFEEHKEICLVASRMLVIYNCRTMFETVDKSDMVTWQKSRYRLLYQAEWMLNRKMSKCEKEMFLFPKICFICYNSNLEELVDCECGLSFCEDHIDSPKHADNCQLYHKTFITRNEFMSMKRAVAPIALAEMLISSSRKTTLQTIPLKREIERLPRSMIDFINTNIFSMGQLSYLQKILIAEIFSRPLTLLYVLRKLNWYSNSKKLVVHVIGTDDEILDDDKSATGYWESVLHLQPKLKKLKVFYIGPKITKLNPTYVRVCKNCDDLDKSLEVRGIRLTYDHYFRFSGYFIKPDIVVGFNFHFHEEHLQNLYNGMESHHELKTVDPLKKIKVPVIMTAGTLDKAKLTFILMKHYLGESLDYHFLRSNPFSGMVPERDYEFTDLNFSNNYITGLILK